MEIPKKFTENDLSYCFEQSKVYKVDFQQQLILNQQLKTYHRSKYNDFFVKFDYSYLEIPRIFSVTKAQC